MEMVFKRELENELQAWKASPHRKPLVIRGARQVGKTTTVNAFAGSYDTYVSLNLERPEDLRLVENDLPFRDVLQRIFLEKGVQRRGETLIFIDEIQNSPRAVELMRYFFEDEPGMHVIAAGSLLEIMMEKQRVSFPVGRVEYRYMFPSSFSEFLAACSEQEALSLLRQVPVPSWALPRLFDLFHRYAQIGGMPEAVERYSRSRDVTELSPVYQGLITAFQDDVGRYSHSAHAAAVIRRLLEMAPFEAGKRVVFARFGGTSYRSRDAGEALRTLERAMLVYLRTPTTRWSLPLVPDERKRPRLQFLDTGLLNHCVGLTARFYDHHDLHAFHQGILAEHVVAQELMAADSLSVRKPLFWIRENRQGNAEVDFLIPYAGTVVPVECKAGKSGTLRSLHVYAEHSHCQVAVRLYSGRPQVGSVATPSGERYTLISLPYFLASMLGRYLDLYFTGDLHFDE